MNDKNLLGYFIGDNADRLNTERYIKFKLAEHVSYLLRNGKPHSKNDIYKEAREIYKRSGGESKGVKPLTETEIKELYELGIVKACRWYMNTAWAFDKACEIYKYQISLNLRTSNSVALQQYSTPAPIAYLASLYVDSLTPGENKNSQNCYLEPTAGNGMLTISMRSEFIHVNELDKTRLYNLDVLSDDYGKVTNRDATEGFGRDIYHGIIANPPFGKLDKIVDYDGYKITQLDHLIALRALDAMRNSGHAAIIIGGHTEWDEYGRIKSGKNRIFLSYLYSHYNVIDVININGELYRKQGTTYPIRLILIAGRKSEPNGYAPLYNEKHDVIIDTFEKLRFRVLNAMVSARRCKEFDVELANLEAEALELELELMKVKW